MKDDSDEKNLVLGDEVLIDNFDIASAGVAVDPFDKSYISWHH